MNRILIRMIAAVSGVIWAPTMSGQSAPIVVTPPLSTSASAADQQWEALKNLGRLVTPTTTTSAGGTVSTRAEQAAALVARANQLRTFYVQYPTHASATEAKRLEVLALSHSAIRGDTSQDTRRNQLIEEVRRDVSLPATKRFEAVAWWRQTSVSRSNQRDRSLFLAAQESISRSLIAEFPTVIDGYESLLGIARACSPERGPPILRDVLAMSAAPPALKTEAWRLLDRFALVGTRLSAVLAAAGANELLIAGSNHAVVVYTWTKALPLSLSAASRYAVQAPNADFVGVCLDADIVAAKRAAASSHLPGKQYYDARGAASALAEQLKIGRDHVVYLADRTGVIRDVQGRDDFSDKFQKIAQ